MVARTGPVIKFQSSSGDTCAKLRAFQCDGSSPPGSHPRFPSIRPPSHILGTPLSESRRMR
ncbi:hypothetical protein BJX61DRAFT_527761 [Aspergillus egyptiacus]|nr:hypothetical protein BJX61DRAFT_527761 [Aspergillus egyptiacus]